MTAGRLVIGTFGSRGGRFMIVRVAGSSMITITGNIAMKKLRNSTIIGVIATPSLMSKTLAARNSITSASSWLIW